MSAEAVRPFLPTLRKVERQLGLPIPARVRILRELEFDLEQHRARLEAEGVAPDEARALSLDALVPDERVLRELGRLHTPRYYTITRHFSDDRVRRFERFALAILMTALLVAESLFLLRAGLFTDPSPFLWPVIGLGGVSCAIIAWEAFALWVRGDSRLAREAPRVLLLMAGLTLMLGLFGALVDTYQVAATPDGMTSLMPRSFDWLVRETALLSVAMVLTLVSGLGWFALTQWLTQVSGAHREVLGLDSTETALQEVQV